ncbi:1231_t:CDS:2 [Paraglomus occultum]|uniref:Postreplication repair E3 ubiquitin-protein ligase RAD18 n=1 Tax=Paraglomus occultum TaxID=144539 RepID=A0A9N9AZ48_9GLOM|nr:1231_t:CDS:2 [Paraglomus occultum]
MTDKFDTLADLDDISEPSDWPQPEYQDFDRATRCSICKDFYNAPVITKCSHTFCSLCLQRYITINSSCPTCRVTVALSETRKNHAVEDIFWLDGYRLVFAPELTRIWSSLLRLARSSVGDEKGRTDARENDSKTQALTDDSKMITSNGSVPDRRNNGEVETAVVSESRPNVVKRKKPKRVYSIMKDHKLRELLKEEGLPTYGVRQQLIRRHAEYVNLYNANVDSAEPKSETELRQILRDWERTQRTDQFRKDASRIWRQSIDSQEYHSKYRDQFAKLIEQAQKSRNTSNASPKMSESDEIIFEDITANQQEGENGK